MHNTVYLVGRLTSDPNYHELGDGNKVSNMLLIPSGMVFVAILIMLITPAVIQLNIF